MKKILITQRVIIRERVQERCDALDQRYLTLLEKCELIPVIAPNNLKLVKQILKTQPVSGFFLSGGNDLSSLGGKVPERDSVERYLIRQAIRKDLPLLGVCRGMQMIQAVYNIKLSKIQGHITKKQKIITKTGPRIVNSYHNFGTTETKPSLRIWATSQDGIVKAIKHKNKKIWGIMWHPERQKKIDKLDIKLIKQIF